MRYFCCSVAIGCSLLIASGVLHAQQSAGGDWQINQQAPAATALQAPATTDAAPAGEQAVAEQAVSREEPDTGEARANNDEAAMNPGTQANGESAGSGDQPSEPDTPEIIAEEASPASTISDLSLRRELDVAYQSLSTALREEDAYSITLGEHYFAYGDLLMRAGQWQDARDAFASALHIEKINNGIYGLNQRHILKRIFDVHFELNEPEKYEDALSRIMWIENQNDNFKDDLAYDMLLRVGNAYIDQFLYRPSAGELARGYLAKARNYMRYAILRYGNEPLSEKPLPYGELALISLLESSSAPRLDRDVAFENMRRQRWVDLSERDRARNNYQEQVFLGGDSALKKYLLKAHAEDNQQEIINALLSLGDMAILFGRVPLAHRYYKQVWAETQLLPDPQAAREELARPVQLPAFNYSQPRAYVERRVPTKLVPLSFHVTETGRVTDVLPLANDDENFIHFKAARRVARKSHFRPALIEGEPGRAPVVDHDFRVKMQMPAENSK